MKDMGAVMKNVKAKFGDARVDGKIMSEAVKKELAAEQQLAICDRQLAISSHSDSLKADLHCASKVRRSAPVYDEFAEIRQR